ncbi:MAG TPA: TetR/AcrR family transcriptional regulator [Ktedonobacterales bacterium]
MPYTREHKQRTRERILRVAARAFREEGIGGVSVPEVMGQAGLTHGGFYGHFPSKDALVIEMFEEAFGETAESLLAQVAQAEPDNPMRAMVRAYLSRTHRDTPGDGCTVATLGAEVARSTPEVRAGFTRALRGYIRRLAAYLPARHSTGEYSPERSTRDEADDEERREDDALVLLAGMAGALQLARAVDDPALSDRILRAARAFYKQSFASNPEQP